jgi:hypothetical protein
MVVLGEDPSPTAIRRGIGGCTLHGIRARLRIDQDDPNFDQVDALLSAANQALTRAMSATPVVTRPVKALVDSAANALKLVETIKTNQTGKVSRQEVATEIARILDEVEKARRHDVELLVEAHPTGRHRRGGGYIRLRGGSRVATSSL